MDDRRELWLKTWFKSWHEGRMSSHHWAPTAEDFPRWAYFRPERRIFLYLHILRFLWSPCGLTSISLSENSENPVTTARWKNSPNFPLHTSPVKNTADKYCQDYADKSCESISFTCRESAGLNRCRRWAWEFPGPTSSHIWTCKVRPWAEIQLGDKFPWLCRYFESVFVSSYRSTASVGVQV